MDNSPGFQAGNAMWYMGLMLPASQNRLLQHLYCNNAARTKIFGILPQHARQSILARMKKVHKCPKCGIERRVAKRCRSRGTCKERDNSMSSPITTARHLMKKVFMHPKCGMERRVAKRCGSHGTREKRDSILAGLKKVYKHPKWGMERRVAKRCGSRGIPCKERAFCLGRLRCLSLFSSA
jgi:hypothetical protein